MEDDEIFKRLEGILRNNKNTFEIGEKKEIVLETHFERDLGFDSLDECEFLYLVEEDFKISIPDEKREKFRLVKDYRDYIKNYQK